MKMHSMKASNAICNFSQWMIDPKQCEKMAKSKKEKTDKQFTQ